tara:strand:+ start:1373 stop:1705 length:333 start_codon:yes stop_codon:yes gene_type:complete
MAQTKINFSNIINSSVQVGDSAYTSEVLSNGITKNPNLIGTIVEVKPNHIIVEHPGSATVTQGMFVLFSKPTEVNDSSLKGYFADVTFKNYSSEYAELYSIGSEVNASSK